MENEFNGAEKARFDTKLPRSQKEFFEYAAALGGYRTLTDFVISSIQEKAQAIVQRHETIIASKRDQKIFFDALMSSEQPNARLKAAAERHRKATSKK